MFEAIHVNSLENTAGKRPPQLADETIPLCDPSRLADGSTLAPKASAWGAFGNLGGFIGGCCEH